MKYYITYFQNIKYFNSNMIPISTAIWDPKWLNTWNGKRCYINENNVMIGIKEEAFIIPKEAEPEEMCSGKPCPYQDKWPHCQFLDAYWKHLQTIDFEGYLIPEFNRVADEVRLATHYIGEPEIVLLVHEKPDNPCSERLGLIQLFKNHGIDLIEWTKEESGIIF